MTFEEIEDFVLNLKVGDCLLIYDYGLNLTLPVVKWYLDEDEVEIWYGFDKSNLEVWVVTEYYPCDECYLLKATKAHKVLLGVK